MAIKLELYTPGRTFMFPNGAIATPEIIEQQFPAISLFPHVIEINGNVLQAVMEFESVKARYGLTDVDDATALQQIEDIINNPPAPVVEVTPQERIAAALEFQNLLSL